MKCFTVTPIIRVTNDAGPVFYSKLINVKKTANSSHVQRGFREMKTLHKVVRKCLVRSLTPRRKVALGVGKVVVADRRDLRAVDARHDARIWRRAASSRAKEDHSGRGEVTARRFRCGIANKESCLDAVSGH